MITQDIGGAFGNKITTHPQLVALCLLARKLGRRGAVDRVADGLPPVDVPRKRALVPRYRGRGDGRRHDDGVPDEGARRRGRVPPLRAARRRHLVAGRARDVRLAQPSSRLHAGDDEQGALLAEPRLLAHAAALVHRKNRRRRRPRARLRPRRAAQEELRAAGADAVRDAERVRLRLRRLPEGARRRARPDRLRHGRGAPQGRCVARQAPRLRDRLHPRLGDEQLRPVPATEPGAPVLRQQRGGDGEARLLRRDRRHARHRPRGRATRRPRRRSRRTSSAATSTSSRSGRDTTTTGTRMPASPERTRASSRSPGSAR